jgi:glycosyltransferase involved in cell wall biosynthesis
MTVGAALIKPAYSKMASAPTKLAEYLGCGVPCLGNAGVGDMEEILEGGRVGVALAGLSEDEKRSGIERLLHLLEDSELTERCVAFARCHFSLDEGAGQYDGIYRRLLSAR